MKLSARLPWIILAAVVVLGACLRIAQYVGMDSFWKDEVGLARNFLKRDLNNIHLPYNDGQTAPIGFVQASKVMEMALGHSEHTFWLLPLITGIAMIAIAGVLWRGRLPTPAWMLAIGAIALNYNLIYQTTQFKPYLWDALWTLIVVWAYWAWYDKRKNSIALYIVSGLAALWASYTAVFVIAGLGLCMIAQVWCDRPRLTKVVLANVVLGVFFVALWLLLYRHIDTEGFFKQFWANDFAPLPWEAGAASYYATRWGSIAEFFFGQGTGMWVVALAIVGFIIAWRQKPELCALAAPIGITWIASMAGAYPMYDRLVLFWLPLVLPLTAYGLWELWQRYGAKQGRATRLILIILLALPFVAPITRFGQAGQRQQLRPVAIFIAQKAQPGDVVYVHERASELFKYYFARYPLKPGVTLELGTHEQSKQLYNYLSATYPGRNVWLAYTEPNVMMDEITFLQSYANGQNQLKGSLELEMAGVMELRTK